MTIPGGSVLFADSNVFVESLFISGSVASVITRIVSNGVFEMATCSPVIRDVENVIRRKLQSALCDAALEQWEKLRIRTRLTVHPTPAPEVVQETYDSFISIMRHEADIEILAAALQAKPGAILSNNRKHFNDAVARKCGIPIFSCGEFVEMLTVS